MHGMFVACFSNSISRLFIACIPFVQSMTTKWTENESWAFWKRRRTYAVHEYTHVRQWRNNFLRKAQKRREARAAKKQEFFHIYDLPSDGAPSPGRKEG